MSMDGMQKITKMLSNASSPEKQGIGYNDQTRRRTRFGARVALEIDNELRYVE
jgi:hypothetical protein